jgi:hypothetical protein
VITATADQIASTIANDPAMLGAVHGFLQAVLGDVDDLGALLDEMAAAIAARSPFADHASLEDVVRREMLSALHALALRRLPMRGNA